MANTANTVSTLNGLFKQSYADNIQYLVPDGVKFYKMVEFIAHEKRPGDLYHQPVALTLEHGFSYGGTNGGVFALEAANSGVMSDASIQGHEMVLRSAISVGAVSRSLNSATSFEKATKHLVANMLRSFTRRLEVQMLYGKRGLGSVSSVASNVLSISDASWAPGIWSGCEGMKIDVYQSDLSSVRVLNLEIASVDFDAKTISVVSGGASVQATDVLFYKGANGNEFDGIESIIRNTGSLFGINASTYNLWQGRVLDNGGTPRDISFELITNAVSKLMEKGLVDRKVSVAINPIQYDVLLADLAAKRSFDQSYSAEEGRDGHKSIKFFSQNGEIEVMSSIYVKAGHAFVLCMEEFVRVGSRDITFDMPGYEGEFFRLLNDSNGYELRAYTDQALFCQAPGLQAIIDDLSVAA